MTKGIVIALSNPTSPEVDDEFNRWYNEVHGRELTSLDSFTSMTRYKLSAQVVPPKDEPDYRYLALYEVDDVEVAARALAEQAPHLQMSDTADLAHAIGFAFVKIFSTKD